MAPQKFHPVDCWVALKEATAGVDNVEGCEDNVEGSGDDVEGSEAPANDKGVHDIAKGSWLHKKLQAKSSMARYLSRFVAGPLKITR